jgi:hypothetical protein
MTGSLFLLSGLIHFLFLLLNVNPVEQVGALPGAPSGGLGLQVPTAGLKVVPGAQIIGLLCLVLSL